jgi:hypothetical protein
MVILFAVDGMLKKSTSVPLAVIVLDSVMPPSVPLTVPENV